jgi:hypothetical protein
MRIFERGCSGLHGISIRAPAYSLEGKDEEYEKGKRKCWI